MTKSLQNVKNENDSAKPEEVEDQIIELIGCKREEILRASGKTGQGVEDVLRAIVERVPAPKGVAGCIRLLHLS